MFAAQTTRRREGCAFDFGVGVGPWLALSLYAKAGFPATQSLASGACAISREGKSYLSPIN
jgi:hypothetical protein